MMIRNLVLKLLEFCRSGWTMEEAKLLIRLHCSGREEEA